MPKKSIEEKDDDETAKLILASIQRSKDNAKNAYKRIDEKIENIKRMKGDIKTRKIRIEKIKEFKSLYPEITSDIENHFEKWLKDGEPKPSSKKTKKEYKESNLMKGRSDLKKVGDKYAVETEMNIKKGLDQKVKRALKKSVDEELDKKIKGRGIRKIKLDMSSDEEETPKRRRGRPKKGKGFPYDDETTSEEESSSDEEDIKEYSKVLKHLIGHLTDRKEKLDPKDAKQAKELINRLIKKRK